MPSAPPRATEMKSNSNKEYVSKRNVSRSVIPGEKPKVTMVSSSEKDILQPAPEEDTGIGQFFPSGSQTSGNTRISIATVLHIIAIIFHHSLSTKLFISTN
ncbi:hypothetical protein WA026_004413 [Henosepilachna vigintioctopunctata]|uniref:Uncharacterized protein n=1 Tax=Henosepilachna vigintioctopunctata TaxID=420089 RepID=A0AAW1VA10_9CUCU